VCGQFKLAHVTIKKEETKTNTRQCPLSSVQAVQKTRKTMEERICETDEL